MIVIRSMSNPRVQRLRELCQSNRARMQAGLCVLEGIHLAQSWCEQRGAVGLEIYLPVRSGKNVEISALIHRVGLEPDWLDDGLFDRVSSLEHSPGPIILAPVPKPELARQLDQDALYLDGIQDPGNLGTILRSAAAFGVTQIITAPGTASCWSPKVLRAGMGAHGLLDIHESVAPGTLRERLGRAIPTGTRAREGLAVMQADLTQPRLWLLGHEGQGLSPELSELPGQQWLSIPQTREQESLNVAMAAAICLYEQSRQRAAPTTPVAARSSA